MQMEKKCKSNGCRRENLFTGSYLDGAMGLIVYEAESYEAAGELSVQIGIYDRAQMGEYVAKHL